MVAPDRVASTAPELVAQLCLASASPRRSEILSRAGFAFEVDAARLDEAPGVEGSDPRALVVALAEAKAASVARRRPAQIVLAADTLVVLDAEVLGKPRDPSEAATVLLRLQGRSHIVITGVAVIGASGRAAGAETTEVRFRNLSEDEIRAYVASRSPMDKAGGYGIQDRPFSPASGISGCYLNVVGLPLCLTGRMLTRAGALRADAAAEGLACPGHDFVGGSP